MATDSLWQHMYKSVSQLPSTESYCCSPGIGHMQIWRSWDPQKWQSRQRLETAQHHSQKAASEAAAGTGAATQPSHLLQKCCHAQGSSRCVPGMPGMPWSLCAWELASSGTSRLKICSLLNPGFHGGIQAPLAGPNLAIYICVQKGFLKKSHVWVSELNWMSAVLFSLTEFLVWKGDINYTSMHFLGLIPAPLFLLTWRSSIL